MKRFKLMASVAAAPSPIKGETLTNLRRAARGTTVAVAVGICSLIAAAGASASPANAKSQVGLCSDFLQIQQSFTGTGVPPAYSSTAFSALIAQNGGIAATTTYCTALLASQGG
jgi:hypothetical protein